MRTIIKKGYTIEVKLPEECGYAGYSIECTYRYSKRIEKYTLHMWLLRDDLDDKFKIDLQTVDMQYIEGERYTIEDKIRALIIRAGLSGFFDPYVDRVQYICSCFDRGNELFEKESLKNWTEGGVENL